MPIAGGLVVPVAKKAEADLAERLGAVDGIEVQQIGPKGIAVVIEADTSGELKGISTRVEKWEEVLDFELAYFNWEDEIE